MKLTKHAKKRMKERGITRAEIERVMASEATIYSPSNTTEGVFKAVNVAENLTVIFAVEQPQDILTVYRTNLKKGAKR
jgi:hypothetical protein